MLNILHTELDKLGVFDTPKHAFVQSLTNAIPFSNVPENMKIIFAISHLSNFASQFRRNITLWDGTSVPTNSIAFVIAPSGANKDSSNSKIKKCFSEGIEPIVEYVTQHATEQAIKQAQYAGEDLPEEPSVYKKYLKPVPPVFTSMTTGPGLVQHINDIGALPALSTSVYTGELSDELASNPHAADNLKILAEVYDLGDKEITYTKGVEFRSGEINGQPVSALFAGSPGHILYDETTRKRFHVTFMSKMARRSWFCYEPEDVAEIDFSSDDNPVQAMLEYEARIEKKADDAIKAARASVALMTKFNMTKLGEPIPVADGIFDIFTVYKRYNKELIAKRGAQDTVYALVRAHLQWKALKFAGALAVIEQTDTVTVEQYVMAIRYAELFDSDITTFEADVNKAPHEYLSDYLQKSAAADNKSFINIHEIKKRGFATAVSLARLQETVHLCAGYDTAGIYTVSDKAGGITYERILKTDILGISYKEIDNSKLNYAIDNNGTDKEITAIKATIGKSATAGYIYYETAFDELGLLLQGDYSYSPFNFSGGVRGKDNIIGGTKWLVIDVDNTIISYKDAHFLLEGINHHVALTSDKTNEFKYRVLIELDSYVELSAIAWKHFFTKIADDLNLVADVLPQSQLFFSYSGRPILSCVDGTPLECRDYIMYALEKESTDGIVATLKKISNGERNSMLNDPLTTFWYAFDCEKGRRSVTLYRAVRHAIDLEADLDFTLDLLDQINGYMSEPLDSDRFNKLKQQVIRLFGG